MTTIGPTSGGQLRRHEVKAMKCNSTGQLKHPQELREFWVVLQQGGTSGECYGEAYVAEIDARKAVSGHKRASYNATYL